MSGWKRNIWFVGKRSVSSEIGSAGEETAASAYRLRPHSKNQRVSNLAEDGNGAEMGGIGAE